MAEENQFLSVIRIWAAMAWADGVIQDEEAAAMKRLIDTAGLDDADKRTALGFLDSQVELDAGQVAGLAEPARLGIYKAAVRLAGVDKVFADEEKQFLERLRGALDIDEGKAAEIRDAIISG